MDKKQRLLNLCEKLDEHLVMQTQAQTKVRNTLREIWRIIGDENKL